MDTSSLAISLIGGALSKHDAASILCAVGIVAAIYLIYRTSIERVHTKTREAEAVSNLHLATAEALATAIDAQDQTSHFHVRRVQVYAVGKGEVLNLPKAE